MADNTPIISENSELISAGLNPNDPSHTTVDFANALANASQTQQSQEAAIARAQEMAKQAKLQTQQQQEAADAGINPLTADYITKDQALNQLKIALAAKHITVDDKLLQDWYDSLQPMVKYEVVQAALDRFAKNIVRTGETFVASTEDAKHRTDENGDALVVGETYASQYDNGGNVTYVRAGQAKPDLSVKTSEKDDQFWTNQWKQRIANKVNPYLASGRTAVGVALQSYTRCVRALATLSKPPVTKQDATNVIMEIGAVYKGGSPDQSAILETSYKTLFGDFNDWTQSLFGKVHKYLPDDILQHLINRIQDLEDQSKKVVFDTISATQALNQDVIDHRQDQWQTVLNEINQLLTDAGNPNSQVHLAGAQQPAASAAAPANNQMDAIANVLGLKKKAAPKGQ